MIPLQSKRRVHLFIRGQVQGVGFRGSLQRRAGEHKVAGWVRNLSDGRVEAVLEGEPKDIEDLIQWCRQGPPRARVDRVNVEDENYAGEFRGFSIRY